MQRHLKCWLWRLVSLLWAEHKFNCSVTGLRKAEKMSMTMLRQQLMKTLKQWRKWFWIIVESPLESSLMNISTSFASCQAIFTDVFGMKRAAAKIFPKLLNFKQKQHFMDVAQEMLTMFNDDADLLKRDAGDESYEAIRLWHLNQSPIILLEWPDILWIIADQ